MSTTGIYNFDDRRSGEIAWHRNSKKNLYTDRYARHPEKGDDFHDIPNIWWSQLGEDVYALKRVTDRRDDDIVRIVALSDNDDKEAFYKRLRNTHDLELPHRARRALGHIAANASVITGGIEVMSLPWWAASLSAATSALTYFVHDAIKKSRQRDNDATALEDFAHGEKSVFDMKYILTLHEHENTAASAYEPSALISCKKLTSLEQLLNENYHPIVAHEVGEVVNVETARERLGALMEWLHPQGKRFFEKQRALREAEYDEKKYLHILDGSPGSDNAAMSRRIFGKQTMAGDRYSIFTQQNPLMMALNRMTDANGFIRSYYSQFASVGTLRSVLEASRANESAASRRVAAIGQSVAGEHQLQQQAVIDAERALDHKTFQLTYMAMLWDKGANIPIPPDAIIANIRTRVWQESLETVRALLDGSQEPVYVELVGKIYSALQNQDAAKNDDRKNHALTEYLKGALAVATTDNHYAAIEIEVEKEFGEYLGLTVSGDEDAITLMSVQSHNKTV